MYLKRQSLSLLRNFLTWKFFSQNIFNTKISWFTVVTYTYTCSGCLFTSSCTSFFCNIHWRLSRRGTYWKVSDFCTSLRFAPLNWYLYLVPSSTVTGSCRYSEQEVKQCSWLKDTRIRIINLLLIRIYLGKIWTVGTWYEERQNDHPAARNKHVYLSWMVMHYFLTIAPRRFWWLHKHLQQ